MGIFLGQNYVYCRWKGIKDGCIKRLAYFKKKIFKYQIMLARCNLIHLYCNEKKPIKNHIEAVLVQTDQNRECPSLPFVNGAYMTFNLYKLKFLIRKTI